METVTAFAAPEARIEDIRDRSSVLSRTFSSVKWFLALTVVADHFIRVGEQNIFGTVYDVSSYPGMQMLAALVVSFLKNYAVPVFFFMSGYLFSPGKRGYSASVVRSMRRLIVPFIIWIFFGLFMAFFHYLPSLLRGSLTPFEVLELQYGVPDSSPVAVLLGLVGLNHPFPEANVPLWYIRDLCVMLLFVPIVDRIARRVGCRAVVALLGLIFICRFSDHSGERLEVGFFFFFFGYMMRSNSVNIVALFRKLFPYALAIYPLLALVHFMLVDSNFEIARIAKNINICVALPLVIYGFYCLVERGWVRGSAFLASASFLVYVTHHPSMWLYKYVALYSLNPADGSILGLIAILLAFVAVILVPVAIYAILLRCAPSVAGFLTGNR